MHVLWQHVWVARRYQDDFVLSSLSIFVSAMCNGICACVEATSVVAAQIPVDTIQSFCNLVIGHSQFSGILSVSAV